MTAYLVGKVYGNVADALLAYQPGVEDCRFGTFTVVPGGATEKRFTDPYTDFSGHLYVVELEDESLKSNDQMSFKVSSSEIGAGYLTTLVFK